MVYKPDFLCTFACKLTSVSSMILKKISILNYKNIEQAELDFSPKLNCFFGQNGMGKTNLLDAVYFLSFCKSAGNPVDSQNIRHEADFFVIQGFYEAADGTPETIYCGMKRRQKKQFKRNKKEYTRLSDHIGFLPLVMVSPADSVLIAGGSEERRRFMDVVISQYDKEYLNALIRYNKAMQQRNTLLKSEQPVEVALFDVLEDIMAQTGEVVFHKREQFIALGQQILERTFKGENLEFSEKGLVNVMPNFEAESVDDIYAKVGEGLVTGWDVMKAVYPGYKQSKLGRVVKSLKVPTFKSKKEKKGEPLKIKGLIPGMAVHFAGCCHPLPGDRIVGIVTTGKGVAVHTIDCKLLEKFANEPERWLDIAWGDDVDDGPHIGRLKVMLNNEPGSLGELSNLIARNNGNIANLNIVYRTISYFELLVDVEVKDLKHLTDIIAALKASKVVSYVSRSAQ